MAQLDERDLIDRKAEQELFGSMLADGSQARLLTICDRGGRGKSSLLRRLAYNCQFEAKPPVPVRLIALDQLGDNPTPFGFVSRVVEGLSTEVRKSFARYNELNDARLVRDTAVFGKSPWLRPETGSLGQASAKYVESGASVVGVKVKYATFNGTSSGDFTEDQEYAARERCVEAFFEDLRVVCAARSFVLLLDGWERCNTELRSWLREELLQRRCLHPDRNHRPARLAIVVAGRPYQPGTENFGLRPNEFLPLFDSEEDFANTVLSIKSLSEWDKEHIRAFMVLNGCPEPLDANIDIIQGLLRRGWTLDKLPSMVEMLTTGP